MTVKVAPRMTVKVAPRMTVKVALRMTLKEPEPPTLSPYRTAKGLDRPGCAQNDRLAFLTKSPHYCARSFGLRPQDDSKSGPQDDIKEA